MHTPQTKIVRPFEPLQKNCQGQFLFAVILRLTPGISARLLGVVVGHGLPIQDVVLQ